MKYMNIFSCCARNPGELVKTYKHSVMYDLNLEVNFSLTKVLFMEIFVL